MNTNNRVPKSSHMNVSGGFTLIEILVVIGIIAILATIVLIALNPARQFKQAHDTQRTSNINAILNAIGQKLADNKGTFGIGGCPNLPTATATIASGVSGTSTKIDLSCLVPTYIPALPFDPTLPTANYTSTSSYNTEYQVVTDSNGRVTVAATSEINPSSLITLTR